MANVSTRGLGGGGAMYCPAVSPHDPNLMFVQCDMGGLYRSTDGGSTWLTVNGREMTASLNFMRCYVAFHPTNPAVVYAFGAYRGIRRSDDGGRTWPNVIVRDDELAPLGAGQLGVTALALDPTSGELLLYGTELRGVWRKDSTGQWVQSAGVTGANGAVIGFFVDPASPVGNRTCFVATRGPINATPPHGIFRSVDNGQTWSPFNTGLPASADVRSFGGGRSSTSGLVLYVTSSSVSSSEGGVYRFTSSGTAWTRAMGAGINVQAPTQQDPDAACPALAQYDWLGVAANNPNIVYVTVCGTKAATATKDASGVYLNSGVFRSTNGGANWQHIYHYVNHHQSPQSQPVDVNHDGGWLDWNVGWGWGGPARVKDPTNDLAGGFAVCATHPEVALFTNKGALYVTKNGLNSVGVTWHAAYADPATARAKDQPWLSVGLEVTTSWHYDIHPVDAQKRYICYTDIGFARSTDGGNTWLRTPPALRRNQQPPGNDYNTVYQLAFDTSVTGRIWAACSDQHDIPYEDWLRVRNGGGVARSDDFGASWADASGNLPSISATDGRVPPVVSILLDTVRQPGSKFLWASVFGKGVYRSDNGGINWTDQSAGLPTTNRNVYRLYQHKPGGTLYCAITGQRDAASGKYTHESGLWKLPPPTSSTSSPGWQRITPPPGGSPDLWWMTDYAVHPTNPDLIYLCTAHVRGSLAAGVNIPGAVYRTANGGQTWSRVLGLAPLPNQPSPPGDVLPWAYRDFVQAFAPNFDPRDPNNNTVYVTTRTHGIWVTRNGGDPAVQPTWREVKNIPFVSAHRLAFDQQGGGAVYLTTFGGGVWADVSPAVTPVRPAPGSTTRDRTPTVVATVRDGLTDLAKSNMQLFLDGQQVTAFSYDQSKDRLTFTPTSQLSFANHTVRVIARDEIGNRTTKQWAFKIVQ
jgi:hypothetical protein